MVNQLLQTIVTVALVGAAPLAAPQDRSENRIIRRASAASQRTNPEWQFVPAVMNVGPLVAEQEGVAGGFWELLSDSSTRVSVVVYTVATAEAAASWLYRQAHGEVAKGWTVVPYDAGDGANLSTYPDPRGFTQYQAAIRKSRFLLTVSGRSKEIVDRFAQSCPARTSRCDDHVLGVEDIVGSARTSRRWHEAAWWRMRSDRLPGDTRSIAPPGREKRATPHAESPRQTRDTGLRVNPALPLGTPHLVALFDLPPNYQGPRGGTPDGNDRMPVVLNRDSLKNFDIVVCPTTGTERNSPRVRAYTKTVLAFSLNKE
jgi:hypothetical protein